MTANTIHTCSYYCERPECVRRQRDELRDRLESALAQQPATPSNARGEWPERYACNGPEGTFWTDDAALANKLIAAAFDRDEWTVTDTQNPTGAQQPAAVDEARSVSSIMDGAVAFVEALAAHAAAGQQPASPSGEWSDVAHEIWAAAQLAPGEGIVDGVARVEALLSSYGRPAAVDGLAARLVDELDGLVGESYGVSGLHLNGDVAPWDDLLPGGRFERLSSLDELRAALAAQQPAAADEAKETDLWRCTVCGRVGTVGRCCGEETRERANMESLQEVDMAITGGFGTTLDMERGTSRKWVMGSDGVKRWADSGLPCEPPSCDECEYCFPDEVRDGDDYVWKHYCNLAEPGGKAIEIDEGECCPDWCPLAMLDEHKGARND